MQSNHIMLSFADSNLDQAIRERGDAERVLRKIRASKPDQVVVERYDVDAIRRATALRDIMQNCDLQPYAVSRDPYHVAVKVSAHTYERVKAAYERVYPRPDAADVRVESDSDPKARIAKWVEHARDETPIEKRARLLKVVADACDAAGSTRIIKLSLSMSDDLAMLYMLKEGVVDLECSARSLLNEETGMIEFELRPKTSDAIAKARYEKMKASTSGNYMDR